MIAAVLREPVSLKNLAKKIVFFRIQIEMKCNDWGGLGYPLPGWVLFFLEVGAERGNDGDGDLKRIWLR